MPGLLLSINWKSNSYDSDLIIVDCMTKIVYYKQVKITIDAVGLIKVIFDIVLRYYGLL